MSSELLPGHWRRIRVTHISATLRTPVRIPLRFLYGPHRPSEHMAQKRIGRCGTVLNYRPHRLRRQRSRAVRCFHKSVIYREMIRPARGGAIFSLRSCRDCNSMQRAKIYSHRFGAYSVHFSFFVYKVNNYLHSHNRAHRFFIIFFSLLSPATFNWKIFNFNTLAMSSKQAPHQYTIQQANNP